MDPIIFRHFSTGTFYIFANTSIPGCMYYIRTFFIVFLLVVLHNPRIHAQFGISHEIGVFAGPANFLTDYGERWNVENNIRNAGMGVGFLHFMNFAYCQRCNYRRTESFFLQHFRIRNEVNFLRSDLEHFGPAATGNHLGARQLQAMHGKSEIFEIGTHLEYHPFKIRDFTHFGHMFSPYISLGVHYVNYDPDAYSDMGSLDDPKNVFETFRGGINLDRGSTYSIIGILGARYRLGWRHDLMMEGRWHYYGTDWIDGLNIDAPQNKFNDLVFWVNVGYVFYLNF